MNKRMGILFSIIIGGLWAMHIIAGIVKTQSPLTIFEMDHVIYFAIFILSVLSVSLPYKISSFSHIILLTGIGIWTLYSSNRGLFPGLSIFFVDILMAYSYGIYNTRPKIRIPISVIMLYFVFLFSPQCCADNNKYINAASWMLFLGGMCFAVWFIFKDQLDRLQELERQNKERYMRIIEEATSVARDAIALCEEEKKKIQKER